MYFKRWLSAPYYRKSIEPCWVQWIHHAEGKTHCPECLKLDGCFFQQGKAPPWPHHPYCHCTLEEVPYAVVCASASVYSDYRKFDPYLFNTNGAYPHTKENCLRYGDIRLKMPLGCKRRWNGRRKKSTLRGIMNLET